MTLLVALGVGAGFFLQNTSLLPSRSTRPSLLPDTVPAPSVQTEELLADFVTRESQRLTAEERFKLTAVTDKVLMGFYDTPAEMREEFRYERLKAGLDSRAFNDFNNKWQAKITAMQIEDSATSMRRIFEALRSGLQSVKSTIDFSDIDFSGEPVEAFEKVPLERNRTIADADVPVTPEVLSEKKTFFLSSPSGRSENVSRKRIFRIRRQ